MKLQDDPHQATPSAQGRAERVQECIRGMEFLYDRLDSGESLDEVAIDLDIRAAGGALSKSFHQFCLGGLEIIREARKAGADRNEVMTYLREVVAKAVCEIPPS
jgi:hypothetical protein